MYTVIGNPKTRALRVIWMLEELGLDYSIKPLDPRHDEVLASNPSGKIPLLVDEGATLMDSVAIVTYLADKHNALTMRAGTIPRALQDSFTQFCVDEVEGALWTAAKNSFLHPLEVRVPQIRAVCEMELARAMATLSTRLGDQEYVMGGAFTVPDLLLGHCGSWAQRGNFEIAPENVVAYIGRILARPAYRAALERAKAVLAA
ncbi:MAG: glutathione S-transferase family protein [Pseudomonadota bacterium]